MNRRGFLQMAAAAFALDHERLLWVPGKKMYSIPKPIQVEVLSLRDAQRLMYLFHTCYPTIHPSRPIEFILHPTQTGKITSFASSYGIRPSNNLLPRL